VRLRPAVSGTVSITMRKPVYLDYAATTPVDPRVAEKMAACLTLDGNFGNPASRSHVYGWRAE
jgi:cysteine desulfurase